MADYPEESVLQEHIPGLETASLVARGGQATVYRVEIDGQVVALKMIAVTTQEEEEEEEEEEGGESPDAGEAFMRAYREVEILKDVDVPVLPKLGPFGLTSVTIGDQEWLWFTEEWIEGMSLRTMLREGHLPSRMVARLGMDIIQATCWLADKGFVHRDIKEFVS